MSTENYLELQRLLKRAGFARAASALSSDVAAKLVNKMGGGNGKKTTNNHDSDDEDESEYSGGTGSSGSLTRRNPLGSSSLGGGGNGSRKRKFSVGDFGADEVFEFLETALSDYRMRNKSKRSKNHNSRNRKSSTTTSRVSEAKLRGLRSSVINHCIHMQSTGLVLHTSGNISVRVPGEELMLVTPTGMDYKALQPEDIVLMDFQGNVCQGEKRKPSSEWRFHGDIYAEKDEAKAIVHTHSTFCTTLACLRRDVPAFHYMIGAIGGNDLKCAEYGTYGTQELSDAALVALRGRKACLLANHGMLSLGKDLKSAMKLAELCENMCEIYWRTLAVTGPVILDDQEMGLILDKFKSYGKQPKSCC